MRGRTPHVPALYACHSSPIHARLIAALDALQSSACAGIAAQLIRSVPTDPDRGLFPQNDDYEVVVGRLLRRSGRSAEVIETCLALLGDPAAHPARDIQAAIQAMEQTGEYGGAGNFSLAESSSDLAGRLLRQPAS